MAHEQSRIGLGLVCLGSTDGLKCDVYRSQTYDQRIDNSSFHLFYNDPMNALEVLHMQPSPGCSDASYTILLLLLLLLVQKNLLY